MNLLHRIEKLERKDMGYGEPLFIRKSGEIIGWQSGDTVVLRRDNETEDELAERVKKNFRGLIWVSINR